MNALKEVRANLDAIALQDVIFPDKPIAVALQEAHDLATFLGERPDVVKTLRAVGLPQAEIDALPRSIDATREAQSNWVVVRDRSKSDAQRDREQAGTHLRSDLVAAARWSLRDDRVAQATVDAIQEGEGVEDLVQDLVDLAALVERHKKKFTADKTFDASGAMEQARSHAEQIRAGLSDARVATSQKDAKLTRDRAFTWMTSRVRAVRAAGNYAYRKEPEVSLRFGSAYERRQRRQQRNVPVDVADGDGEGSGSGSGSGTGAAEVTGGVGIA